MTYTIRKNKDRKYFDHGWLKTYHTFSFGDYFDSRFMGFRQLRVINEDRVAPSQGFSPHKHQDMEILTLVLEGELAHQDSMGNASVIKPNEVQAMSAGTGITHSEYNSSSAHSVHLLQIWVLPDTKGIAPRYQMARLPSLSNQWQLIASKHVEEASIHIQQDINLYAISLEPGTRIKQTLPSKRYGWLQVIDGKAGFLQDKIESGDGVAISSGAAIEMEAEMPSRMLLFDLG